MKYRYLEPEEKEGIRFGKRVWLNFLNRNLLQSRRFKRSIKKHELTGIISSAPAMAQCIARDKEYRVSARRLVRSGMGIEEVYLSLVLEDAQNAADLLLPMFEASKGRDGFVGIDVLPEYAYDVDAIIEEANAVWHKAGRPNIMIQLPATEESVPAFRELLQSGVNVNATLLCSLARYRDIARAHVDAIANRLKKGLPTERIVSAATFSLPGNSGRDGDRFRDLCLSAAVGAAWVHYDLFHSGEFRNLAEKEAGPQLLLCLEETETSHTFGKFCCARDLATEVECDDLSTPPKPESVSGSRSSDEEENLDMLQEEFIKQQVVEIDRALGMLNESRSVSSRQPHGV